MSFCVYNVSGIDRLVCICTIQSAISGHRIMYQAMTDSCVGVQYTAQYQTIVCIMHEAPTD